MPAFDKPMENMLHQREKDSFNHSMEIVKPYGVIEQILEWSKLELVADWRWQLVEVSSDQKPGKYIFYFDSERDLFAFTLKWS